MKDKSKELLLTLVEMVLPEGTDNAKAQLFLKLQKEIEVFFPEEEEEEEDPDDAWLKAAEPQVRVHMPMNGDGTSSKMCIGSCEG